jgi:uncharacterized membrane protein
MWENIIPLVVIIVLIVLVLKVLPLLGGVGRHIMSVGGHDGDPVIGLIALGIICVTAVGIVRLLSNGRR